MDLIPFRFEECVGFLRRLLQTRSLPGDEGQIARIVVQEMERLGYDEAFVDQAGNVIGRIAGEGLAPPAMFNTHLDHVDVGNEAEWPYPPFAAEISEGKVWGRGAMDIKGPLAAQVYGVGTLLADSRRPPGDLYVTAVVQEEVGGLGARFLATHLQTPLVVVGEATGNQLRRGHRGRTELTLDVRGRSVHASVPEKGINPLHVVARFISGLDRISRKTDPVFGGSTVAPTLIRTDQTSPNVVPARAWLTCDWRRIPSESQQEVQQLLQDLADNSLIPGAVAEVLIPTSEKCSYTGLTMLIPSDHPPFVTPLDHPALVEARSILSNLTGKDVPVEVWRFATDGGHFAEAGMTVIGYGPGDELLAHTIRESISLEELREGVAGYRELARHWALRSGSM